MPSPNISNALSNSSSVLDPFDSKILGLSLIIQFFETLKLYPLQKQNRGYFVRDYWVDIEQKEEEIEVQVFYLPRYR